MTAFMHAGCERLLPSLILALIIELGLQRISGAVSPLVLTTVRTAAVRSGSLALRTTPHQIFLNFGRN